MKINEYLMLSEKANEVCSDIDRFMDGEETKRYISKVLSRLTVLGATFLVIIAGLPILFSKVTSLPTSVSIGGTGLLIVVGVALETYKQLEGSILSRSYKRGYRR